MTPNSPVHIIAPKSSIPITLWRYVGRVGRVLDISDDGRAVVEFGGEVFVVAREHLGAVDLGVNGKL